MGTALTALPATFTTGEARAAGVSPRDLYAWRDSDLIIELSRGVWQRADAVAGEWPDLVGVARRAPEAIVCCVSAAAVWDLTDELPVAVQIAVPAGAWVPRISYPPAEVFQFRPALFAVGLTYFEAAPGEQVRIYDPARTVADLIRFRRRFGEPVAYGALRRYLAQKGSQPRELTAYAKTLNVAGPVRAALKVATA